MKEFVVRLYPDSTRCAYEVYDDGKPHGVWKWWGIDGRVVFKAQYYFGRQVGFTEYWMTIANKYTKDYHLL